MSHDILISLFCLTISFSLLSRTTIVDQTLIGTAWLSAMTAIWRPFTTTFIDSRIPPLLISTTFTVDSYKIYLTDLAHLWCEDLDRRSILRRSLAEDTSIDPSQDSGQFKLFLEKVRLGLEGGKDVDLLLSLDSHASKEGSPNVKNLDINLRIALPTPLQPLNWTMKLACCPQSDFATHFIIPLLYAQNARLKELDSLVSMLRDKDNVIQKLADKLEATGAELGQIFPGAAGKGGRKISRRAVEEKVKGLGTFEPEQWRNSLQNIKDDEQNVDMKYIVQRAFTEQSAVGPFASGTGNPNLFGKWWEQLKDGPMYLSTQQDTGQGTDAEKKDANTEAAQVDIDATESEDNGTMDDFQVAATPPPQRSSTSRARSPPPYKKLRGKEEIDDTTDDSDDLGASQPQPITIRDSFPAPKVDEPAVRKELEETEKGPKTSTKTKSEGKEESKAEHQEREIRTQKRSDDDDNETEEEEDEGIDVRTKSSAAHRNSSPKSTTKIAKKGGIGKIGGKKPKPSPISASPPKKNAPVSQETEPSTRSPKSKICRIGRKPIHNEASDNEVVRGRQETKEDEKPRETSEERAQRNREELKRQLEEKAKAPAKKKRKF